MSMPATADEEIKQCFECFAGDNNGKLLVEDLGVAIRALGKAPYESDIRKMEEELGEQVEIGYATFKDLYNRKMGKPSDLESDMRQAFQVLDAGGNGLISEADLRQLLGGLGEKMDSDLVDSLVHCASVDRDGNIAFDDLVSLILSDDY